MSELESILSSYEGRGRDALLPLLYDVQDLVGWLPGEIQEKISTLLRVPLAEIHGVIEFYSMFYNKPMPRRPVRVCQDPACQLFGADEIGKVLSGRLGDDTYLEFVPCLGMCEHAPVALFGERPYGNLSQSSLDALLNDELQEPVARTYGEPRWILGRVGKVDPGSLDEYEELGGYTGLRRAIEMSPEDLIELMEESGILGRGGAMFPLGRKWRFTRSAAGSPEDKHVVVNADESEPGTFKDRCLLEEDPFVVIEGATLAAYAIGAENGWIFVRGEYSRAYKRLRTALEKARSAGYLGRDILGHNGFNFDIELRRGAGAYICGEETALFEAIEGKRGFPRIKPPFPVTQGLFQKPTAINNVETLAAAVAVLNLGIEQWRSVGTEQSPGTKLFCISGHVENPGLYELPFGNTVADLIGMAGGLQIDNGVQAVLMGGAAGVFIGPESLELKLSYESARKNSVPLGSGVLMVFDQSVDLRQVMWQLSRFFTHESCGKCFPCQLGTKRQEEILERIATTGTVKDDDKQTLLDVGFTMSETSLCGLGQTAASAVLSAVSRWPELVE